MKRLIAATLPFFLIVLSCAMAWAVELERVSLTSLGVERAYYLYKPRSYDASKGPPLVIVLPRGGQPGPNALEQGRWDVKAEREGFLLVLGEGRGFERRRIGGERETYVFNDGSDRYPDGRAAATSDVTYLRDVLDDLARRAPYDPRRVFMAGFAMGGSMTYFAATQGLGERLAAIGVVSGHMWDEAPPQPNAPSLIAISGTDDPINPMKEGLSRIASGSGIEKPAPRTSVQRYAQMAGLSLGSTLLYLGDGLFHETYGPSERGTEAVYYFVQGLGHQWPGSDGVSPNRFGPPSSRIDATDVVWSFFVAHPRR